MTLQQRLDWWEARFAELVERGRKGQRNLELAAAMCIGATTALRDQIKQDTSTG